MTFPTNHQEDTSTERFHIKLTLYQFGLFISLGLLTMVTLNLIVSGDSTTPKQSSTTHQLIQKQWEM